LFYSHNPHSGQNRRSPEWENAPIFREPEKDAGALEASRPVARSIKIPVKRKSVITFLGERPYISLVKKSTALDPPIERLTKTSFRRLMMNRQEIPLNQLPMGVKAKVTSLQARGSDRRRMLDLGVISGTLIEPLYKSPAGNPVAYRIRGAVIALRADVSGKILVTAS
jgi:ferrous iron transport protein A